MKHVNTFFFKTVVDISKSDGIIMLGVSKSAHSFLYRQYVTEFELFRCFVCNRYFLSQKKSNLTVADKKQVSYPSC